MARRTGGRKGSFVKFVAGVLQAMFYFIWKTLPLTLALGFFYLTFFGVHRFLYADPYFQIRMVKVFPKGILNAEEYGILERRCANSSILDFDLKDLADFIEANPRVKQAKVYRHLPSELEIFIVPRTPLVELRLSPKGDYYELDQDGVVMAKSKMPDPALVTLEHFDYSKKSLNIFDFYDYDAYKKLPGILETFRQNKVTAEETISKIAVDHLGNYSIFLLNGPELKICQNVTENLLKLNAIGDLMNTGKRSEIEYMDLCLDDVVIQPLPTKKTKK